MKMKMVTFYRLIFINIICIYFLHLNLWTLILSLVYKYVVNVVFIIINLWMQRKGYF